MSRTVRVSGTLPMGQPARTAGRIVNNRRTPMSSKIPFPSIDVDWLRFGLPAFASLLSGNAWGAYQDIHLNPCSPPPYPPAACVASNVICYSAKVGSPMNSISEDISVINANGSVSWSLTKNFGCTGTAPNFTCSGMNVTVPSSTDPTKVHIGNTNNLSILDQSEFSQTVSDSNGNTCSNVQYLLRVTSDGGGWGDPHITTVDGVHYDFQSAGEFIALRGDGLEIQTRQTPIATTFLPGANPYTGLATCVSVYSAVAARVGKHRVSYQPNISGVPDPTGLQLRVDGVLTTLGPEGIDLGGRESPPG